MMKELLSKKTEVTVHRAEDGMRVAPDSLYLMPPKKNLTIFHGKLMLGEQDHSRGIKLPIDVFLRSLAEDQGEEVIGVILSGTSNEELHTVNAEYQRRILELTELNNDVENLLTSTRIGQLLLDENLEIRKHSPEIGKIFKIWDTDIGRPMTHLSHRLVNVDPVKLARDVLDRADPVEKEVSTEDGAWYLMRILPYQIGPNTYSGAVMTFVDITHFQENQRALAESENGLRETARLARVGSWSCFAQTGEHRWLEETFRIHDLAPGDVEDIPDGVLTGRPDTGSGNGGDTMAAQKRFQENI